MSVLKSRYVGIRMNPDLYQKIYASAAKRQHTDDPSVSQHIRDVLTESEGMAAPDMMAAMNRYTNQIARIGNNINQIAYVLNSGMYDQFNANQLQGEMEDIKELQEELKDVIKAGVKR